MEKPYVLIVDDNQATVTLVSALLHRDYQIEAAIDGTEAVEKLKTKRYGAIVLDLKMPAADGYFVLDFLQAQQKEMLPRVVVVTAALTGADVERATAYGIHSVIPKPFEIEVLVNAVKQCAALSDPPLTNLLSSGMILLLADMLRHRF